MPNKLVDLSLEEVSLVDVPSNPGARVAFWKRDGRAVQKGKKTMLKKRDIFAAADAGNVRKSFTRADVSAVIDAQICKRGASWILSPEGLKLTEVYNSLPADVLPPARVQKAAEMGNAEMLLEVETAKIQKSAGLSYEAAFMRACDQFPETYRRMQDEIAKRCEKDDPGTVALQDGNGEECGHCGADVPAGAQYCPGCGAAVQTAA